MPPNQALPCSLCQPPSHFLHEELDQAVRVYITYTHSTVPQFTPLKKYQDWKEERLDSAVMEKYKGQMQTTLLQHNNLLSYN